ncbi:MAG: GGDEF domain-containing protein [Gammaproteobacteria bacterium]
MRRSNKEFMLITLSMVGALAISPFAVIRLWHGEWIIGLLDSILVVGMVFSGVFIYFTHKIKVAGIVLTVFTLTGTVVAIYLIGTNVVFWAYPAMVGVYFILVPRLAITLTLLAALALIPALYQQMELTAVAAVIITLFVNNVFSYVFARRMHNQRDQLSLLVRRDPLTGAGNRRALDEKLDEIIALNKRIKHIVSVVVIDVDHFKRINDKYGHTMGDQVLVKLTNLIKKRIRATDSLYRYGGEEFVVILMNASLETAAFISEQLRIIIESNSLVDAEVMTISLGVAEFIEGESADHWLDRGDKALYQAKATGRNKTCAAN